MLSSVESRQVGSDIRAVSLLCSEVLEARKWRVDSEEEQTGRNSQHPELIVWGRKIGRAHV